MNNIIQYTGNIIILGRSNVGKSTLLNTILGKKISITAAKVQTTRNKIAGIKTINNFQFIYYDTPGIYKHPVNKFGMLLSKYALNACYNSDVIIFVIGTIWNDDDEFILQYLRKIKITIILIINKIDLLNNKTNLLSYIDFLRKKLNFAAIIPISAIKNINITNVEKEISKYLPEKSFFFPKEQYTDKDQYFLASEIIREKLTRFLGQELPYSISVEIEKLIIKNNIVTIFAIIYVERYGQKIIIIGSRGNMLKKIATIARQDLEKLFMQKVYLQVWVKIRKKWTNNIELLHN